MKIRNIGMKRLSKKVLNLTISLAIWICVLALFGVPLLCDLSCMLKDKRVLMQIRFPLGLPGGLCVNRKGEIYCALNTYSRIQAYDKDGNFIRGWFAYIQKAGPSDVIIDANGLIHVETTYSDRSYDVFNSEGELLENRSRSLYEEKKSGFLETKDNLGNTYKIKDVWFYPKIVKIDSKGTESTVISDPWYLWIFKAPLPTGGFILIAVVIGVIAEFRKSRAKKKTVLPRTNISS